MIHTIKPYCYTIALALITSLATLSLSAQNVGINSSGANPNTSAMLDVVADDKGILVPRVDIVDLATPAPITGPTTSLLVYNTNATSGIGYYFWDGVKWVKIKDVNSNADYDWHEVGGTSDPDAITDDIFTQGNVGIGTNTPYNKLHLFDQIDGPFPGLVVDNRKTYGVGTGVNETSRIILSLSEAATADPNSRVMGYIEGGTTSETSSASGFLALGTGNSGAPTEKMRILNNGNVGIGLINPQSKLSIVNNNNLGTNTNGLDNGILYINNGTTSDGSIVIKAHNLAINEAIGGLKFHSSPDAANYSSSAIKGLTGSNGRANQLAFYTSSNNSQANAPDEVMRIVNDKIGIGTSIPENPLHVKTSLPATVMRLQRTSGQNVAMVFENNQDSVYIGLTEDEDFAISHTEDLNNSPYLVVDHGGGTGNVGIGLNNPIYKLDISAFSFKAGNDIATGTDAGVIKTSYLNSSAGFELLEYDDPFILRGIQTGLNDGDTTLLSFHKTNLGIGANYPTAKLDLEAPGADFEMTNISNANFGVGTVLKTFQKNGTYSGDITITVNSTNWKSCVYDIKIAGSGGGGHFTGWFYNNNNHTTPGTGITANNGGCGVPVISRSTFTNTFTIPLTSNIVHPIVILEMSQGGGYSLKADDITITVN